MGKIKDIYTLIITMYPDKKEKIMEDFKKWNMGYYALPRTQELRNILNILNEEF